MKTSIATSRSNYKNYHYKVKLTISAIDLSRRKITVQNGKGMKDRIVYISSDAGEALVRYLKARPLGRVSKVFLVEKGTCKGRPISVRGVQKRMEYYARKSGIDISCHQLRHHADSRIMPTPPRVFPHPAVIPAFFSALLLANAA